MSIKPFPESIRRDLPIAAVQCIPCEVFPTEMCVDSAGKTATTLGVNGPAVIRTLFVKTDHSLPVNTTGRSNFPDFRTTANPQGDKHV